VNTVIREKDGELQGYNTDCEGALSAVEDGLRHSGTKTCVCSYCFKVKLLICVYAQLGAENKRSSLNESNCEILPSIP
jgi:hypothetical protein